MLLVVDTGNGNTVLGEFDARVLDAIFQQFKKYFEHVPFPGFAIKHVVIRWIHSC